jgi:hypothetical protein
MASMKMHGQTKQQKKNNFLKMDHQGICMNKRNNQKKILIEIWTISAAAKTGFLGGTLWHGINEDA